MKKILVILAAVFSLVVIGCSNPAAMDPVPEAKWEVGVGKNIVGEDVVKVTSAPNAKYVGCFVHQQIGKFKWNGIIEFEDNAVAVENINTILDTGTAVIYYSAVKETVWINEPGFDDTAIEDWKQKDPASGFPYDIVRIQ